MHRQYLRDTFPIQIDLKQEETLSLWLYKFTLEYVTMKVQEIQLWLKMNGAQQFLVCADDVNLMGDNIYTTRRNTDIIKDASAEIGLHF